MNRVMNTESPLDLLRIPTAMKQTGLTRRIINTAIKNGELVPVVIDDTKFLRKSELDYWRVNVWRDRLISTAERQQMREAFEGGMSRAEIARTFNRHRREVSAIVGKGKKPGT